MPPFSSTTDVEYDHHETRPQTATTGFASGLMDTILVSKSKLRNWAEMEKAKADAVAESYRQKLMEEQALIDSKMASLLVVQMERGLNVSSAVVDDSSSRGDDKAESIANQKCSLEGQKMELETEIAKLQTEYQKRQKRILDIEVEESKQLARAQEARALKERVEETKQTTVDDLTKGIVNYKHAGLDFEKTDGENELRFFFSQLDPSDPMRQFSFVLQVDFEDKYEVANCEPSIDAAILLEISQRLNEKDDMSYLVRKMRRAFAETL